MNGYVVCPVTITGPVAHLEPPMHLPPNLRCGLKCPVKVKADAMQFRCARGHSFFASPADVQSETRREDEEPGASSC